MCLSIFGWEPEKRFSESSEFGLNVAWTKSVRDSPRFKKTWAENLFMLLSFANSEATRGGLPSIRIKLNLDCRDRRSTLIYCSCKYLARTAQFSTSELHSDWLNVGLGKFLELSHRCGIIKTVWGRMGLGESNEEGCNDNFHGFASIGMIEV